MTIFKITITSDTICPWCYVGHEQLKLAEQLWKQMHPNSDDSFSVSYRPFQLLAHWPRGPTSSVSNRQLYAEKFGSEGRAEIMHDRMKGIGKAVGIDFKFGGYTGNSRDSHRLVHLAKKHGNKAEMTVIEGLFASHFEQERDIAQYDTLERVALEAGILLEEFQTAIRDSDAGGPEVDREVEQARLGGISGVPHYVIQDQFQLHGSNDPASFIRVFEKIKAKEI